MRLFGSSRNQRVVWGRHLGRELTPGEHAGWRKLVLVRHGEIDFNLQHRLPGQLPGIALNARGKAEAQALAEALRPLPISAIVTSPLERAVETATLLNAGRGLDLLRDPDLMDTNYGRYSGMCWDDLDARDREWRRFVSDPTHTPTGAESFASVSARAVRSAERWRHTADIGEWVALVTHADLVKMLVAHYMGIPLRHVPLIGTDNASATLLAFHPDPRHAPTLLASNWSSPALWINAAQPAT